MSLLLAEEAAERARLEQRIRDLKMGCWEVGMLLFRIGQASLGEWAGAFRIFSIKR